MKQVETDSAGFLKQEHGRIIHINDVYLIECVKGDEVKRYVPEFLPDDFKTAGGAVTFSATILKHDPNVRMMGTPVRITELMMEEEIAFDETLLQEVVKEHYPFDSVGYLQESAGVIKLIADVYVIEVTVNGEMTRYLPAILPKDFQVAEKKVVIAGTIGRIPANVRMMGTPLTLAVIKNN